MDNDASLMRNGHDRLIILIGRFAHVKRTTVARGNIARNIAKRSICAKVLRGVGIGRGHRFVHRGNDRFIHRRLFRLYGHIHRGLFRLFGGQHLGGQVHRIGGQPGSMLQVGVGGQVGHRADDVRRSGILDDLKGHTIQGSAVHEQIVIGSIALHPG